MKRTAPPKRPRPYKSSATPGDKLRRAAERNTRRATRTLQTQLAQALVAGCLR